MLKLLSNFVKDLTQSDAARAVIDNVSEAHEPFCADTNFTVIPPSKHAMRLENLSGGEKAIATLALLFAMYAGNPSPFFVLDEADAALDICNLTRVSAAAATVERRIGAKEEMPFFLFCASAGHRVYSNANARRDSGNYDHASR